MNLPGGNIGSNVPPALQPAVALWHERLLELEKPGTLSADVMSCVARVVACSEFAGNTLLRNWPWFVENVRRFEAPDDDLQLDEFVAGFPSSEQSWEEGKSALRQFRNRYLLRVLWREVHGLADLDETLLRLSRLADRLLDASARAAVQALDERFGRVRSADGEPVPLVILGMGKLGGGELNFSSDIDLIFCYPEDGRSDGARSVSAQEYFGRVILKIIDLLDDVTADGFVFRVDTRLRPFGDSGPPVVSFAALESYLLQHGRDWERYAYVKARAVGPRLPAAIREDLYENYIRPFVYRRYLDFGIFESLREMHALIAAQVRRKELADNIKLGPGGIREAEFVVQTLQLVRGGTEPQLQCRELQVALPRLVGERGLNADDAEELRRAYRFLRRLENFMQAIRDQQTHDLPTAELDRQRLCCAMGYSSWDKLQAVVRQHRAVISKQFAATAFRDDLPQSSQAQVLGRLWESKATIADWHEALSETAGQDAENLATQINQFMNAPATRQVGATAGGRLHRFVPTLLLCAVATQRPAIALQRTLVIVERVLRRSAYLSLLNENHLALSRLVDLCEQNLTIANQIARYPILLDELLDFQTYPQTVSKSDLENELARRIRHAGVIDGEQTMQVIARFQRSSLFRIALSDFNGSLPVMKVSDALTWLAETVVGETLRVATADLSRRHGRPKYVLHGEKQTAGFAVIGYGKLGGLEFSYASDLDIVFVHDSCGNEQYTDGDKPLENEVFFARLAQRLVLLLTTQTETGRLYQVDMRLRPDGASGLLVTNVQAFERYQVENAWTWEHQALLRARAIAGDIGVMEKFDRIREDTLLHRVDRSGLRDDVIDMRRRMRKELDRSDASNFDLKHGRGGIGDIEFLVQFLVLREAPSRPELIRYTDNIRQLDALIEAGFLDAETGQRLQDAYRCYRAHSHYLVLDGRRVRIESDRFEAERKFVRSQWLAQLGGVRGDHLS
jgi:glutamate-ammonia-ligase adenylyltransferase